MLFFRYFCSQKDITFSYGSTGIVDKHNYGYCDSYSNRERISYRDLKWFLSKFYRHFTPPFCFYTGSLPGAETPCNHG